ncbi:hypothetical protein [Bosea robiniae]|uniref:Intracellular septation protein A n=1 Tax=Bosea robiniae TaxID=1036780 RepID=A0ABY0P484_9HYPH|nr:hypothetical protein [Bosea robiniae]SDH22498.1 hypothetical protein SAMN05421844_107210 [Bosea robiniae]
MNILLAFAPFLAFALVDRALGSLDGLLAGAAVSIAMLVRDMMQGRSPKILEIGTVLLFAGLAGWFLAFQPAWSIIDVRLRVDLGLLLIVIVSMLIGKPFTLQYARESVAPELWSGPTFVKTSYVISAAWAAAFVVLVAVDLLWIYRPDVPPRLGVWATIAALFAAVKFTAWYPKQVHGKAR